MLTHWLGVGVKHQEPLPLVEIDVNRTLFVLPRTSSSLANDHDTVNRTLPETHLGLTFPYDRKTLPL